ncbi:heat shock factor protein 3-like isoform X2 [Sceloporus undulatus]|uniref:heat shock factor protein 3-like isoform X2 n=1 Tax=Sceloporus undulatus TaxID=8520 RepID=UPI001C4DC56C|nr:heat shock factor protein 3-like isoform X2 [Sceloporus undulatus]
MAAVAGAMTTTVGGVSPVPGFLAKLWALVEDPASDDVISWSPNGQNFCILDEQRFAKELLPKYFKHNNLSSFIRQLNIYGFRKVIALESGMMITDKSCAIEFQHPYFKRGKANLLGNIKRKVSTVRAEDLKVCPDELHKVLSEVQEMREQQNNMDLKLASMKRENKALWKEVASLRQKHSQQQQLLSKILEFILGLMRGNCILGLKRKRPLPDTSGGSPSKYSRSYVRIPVENCETAAISEHGPDCEDSIIIRDITDAQEEEEEEDYGNGTDKLLALVHTTDGNREAQTSTRESIPVCEAPWTLEHAQIDGPVQFVDAPPKTNAVELYPAQVGTGEDPATMIDSILNENQTVAQNESLLDRDDIQDFLNCIDASLEELQAMLSGKKLHYASDAIADTFSPELPVLDANLSEAPAGLENTEDLPGSPGLAGMSEQESSGKNGEQLREW